MWQDIRYALRVLGRSPGFAAVAVLTLALGIGANTAMFAVVNAVLLKPLPFHDPERLMLVHMLEPDGRAGPGVFRESIWSYPKYRTFAELQRSFDETAVFAGRDVDLAGDADPERVRGEVVSGGYPAVLGVAPLLGRAFTREETDRAGAPAVVLIGHGLWTRRYGSSPTVLGRTIQINATPYTIVGVLPRGFRGMNGNAELWTPIAAYEPSFLESRRAHSYTMIARRKADVSEAAAAAAVRAIGQRIGEQDGDGWGASTASLAASRVDADIRRAAWVVLGAVGFVLLIACVNLTNLLVARALGRRREVAVRVALGASRGRVARQFGIESLVLASLGAAAGLVVAAILLNVAAAMLPDSDVFFRTAMAPDAPRTAGADGLTRIGAGLIGFDAMTLLFTCVVTAITALLVALMPALHGAALRPIDALKATSSAGTGRGWSGGGARGALVATQIALALVLLTGAGLMLKSAARLHRTSIGVIPDRVVTVRVDLPGARYRNEASAAFFAQLVERVRALPGVEAAGLGNCAPVSGGCNVSYFRRPDAAIADKPAGILWATPEYFAALGIQLQRGRTFTDRDRADRPRVALINEAAARTFFPREDPIGKTIAVGQARGFHQGAEVVGIVANVRYGTIETAAKPDVYVPLAQAPYASMRLFVRAQGEATSLVPAIRRELRALDARLPLSEIKTMSERLGDAMWRTRVGAWLLSTFAAVALLLTGIGVFGVMAQTVVQRTAEIGIRMALGAERRDVLTLVLGRALLVTAAGVALGLASAFALTRLMATLLYDVTPTDPLTFASVAIIITLVALAACYVPARRATRVDAVVALRTE